MTIKRNIETTYGTDVSTKILAGMNNAAKIVGETLGPLGHNVIIQKQNRPRITKDGITVLQSIGYKDPYENIAADLLREASDKTNREAGDGTTGTCILAASIFNKGLKHCIAGNRNSIQIRNGLSKAAKTVEDFVSGTLSKPIETKHDIQTVAKISSNHSDEIASVLAHVFDKIGKNGAIKIENGNGTVMDSKIVDGMHFDQGYLSNFFVTNESMECDLDNPFIFIVDKKITNIQEILVPLQSLSQLGKPILVIAEDVDGDALSTMVLNKLRGLPICAVKSPSYGQNRVNLLHDIAILTGGKVISDETGIALNTATVDSGILGTAKRVIVTKDTTTIIGGNGDPNSITERIEQLKRLIENESSEYEKKKLQERLAKLDGGVGIIYVGANTETELLEKKDLVDDAFCACKAAIADGVVPGGGVALLLAKKVLADEISKPITDENSIFKTDDEKLGGQILLESLDAPIRKIIENAGESPDMILAEIEKINSGENKEFGYDALNKKFGNMFELGVIDPARVITAEVKNSSTIAGLLLTTSAACIEIPDENVSNTKQMTGYPQSPVMPGGMY